jgi:hypothetical protein
MLNHCHEEQFIEGCTEDKPEATEKCEHKVDLSLVVRVDDE